MSFLKIALWGLILMLTQLTQLTPAVAEDGHYSRAVNFYLDGQMPQALEALEAAYGQDPSDRRVRGLLSEVLVIKSGRRFEQGDIAGAFEHIKRAREISPKDEKIESVFYMLDEKLNPDKYRVSVSGADEDVFGEIKRETEEKRQERVRIIHSPPQQLTVRERELLRPILVGAAEQTGWSPGYYIAVGTAFLLAVLFITGSWIKRVSAVNAEVIEKIMEKSESRAGQLEAELKRLREREENSGKRQAEEKKRLEREEKLKEERIKAQYHKLLAQARSSGGSPRKVAEPQLSESKRQEKHRRELIKAFEQLKKKNTRSAVNLLKSMSRNENPWVRLWCAQLAAMLDAENARQSLLGLIDDREYGVKKEAIRTLRGFLDDKSTTIKEKRLIREIIDGQRSDGWVV